MRLGSGHGQFVRSQGKQIVILSYKADPSPDPALHVA